MEYVLLQGRKCALLGLSIVFALTFQTKVGSDTTASLDRIDPSYGYIVGNVQLVHKDINYMKGNTDQPRFIELCCLVALSH